MFPLCSSCVREEQQKPWLERSNMCGHNAQERTLRGTWCTPELQKVVEKGYQILKIHECGTLLQRTDGLGCLKSTSTLG